MEAIHAKVMLVAVAVLSVNKVAGKGADVAAGCTGAEQLAVLPPVLPLHIQFQRVELDSVTAEALPLAHRFVVGALRDSTPLEVPHRPLIGADDGVVTDKGLEKLLIKPLLFTVLRV